MRTRVLARRGVVLVIRAAAWALARLQGPSEEDEGGELPPGHPVVTQGPEARRMVEEGRPAPRTREEAPPPKLLKGSARERMVRARRGAGRG